MIRLKSSFFYFRDCCQILMATLTASLWSPFHLQANNDTSSSLVLRIFDLVLCKSSRKKSNCFLNFPVVHIVPPGEFPYLKVNCFITLVACEKYVFSKSQNRITEIKSGDQNQNKTKANKQQQKQPPGRS